ncbi:MAG: thioredoxin family protein [Nitrososphaerota archaeon]
MEIRSVMELVELVKTTPILLVDFYATWCPPCKTLEEHLKKIAGDLIAAGIQIVKANVDELDVDDAAEKLKLEKPIRAVPTLILFKNGEEVGRIVGVQAKTDFHVHLKETILSMASQHP